MQNWEILPADTYKSAEKFIATYFLKSDQITKHKNFKNLFLVKPRNIQYLFHVIESLPIVSLLYVWDLWLMISLFGFIPPSNSFMNYDSKIFNKSSRRWNRTVIIISWCLYVYASNQIIIFLMVLTWKILVILMYRNNMEYLQSAMYVLYNALKHGWLQTL